MESFAPARESFAPTRESFVRTRDDDGTALKAVEVDMPHDDPPHKREDRRSRVEGTQAIAACTIRQDLEGWEVVR